jgi:transposase
MGKGFHWAVVLNAGGEVLISRKVENNEADLKTPIEEVLACAAQLSWAIDQPGGTAALLLALLWEREQCVLYVPGIAVDRARDAYRGEPKTDPSDARLIAEQARMRRDLGELKLGEELLTELRLLVTHRRNLVADQTRTISRLRDALLALFPGLARALDLNAKGALVLVSRYQTPRAVCRSGRKRIEAYLKGRSVQGAARLTEVALTAAKAQQASLPAEEVASRIVAELAEQALALKERICEVDAELKRRFFAHPHAEILVSLPGMGPLLGAEFLVAAGELSAFSCAGTLAAYAGLVPAARDSGKSSLSENRLVQRLERDLGVLRGIVGVSGLRGTSDSAGWRREPPRWLLRRG